jgi:hypothetical protein
MNSVWCYSWQPSFPTWNWEAVRGNGKPHSLKTRAYLNESLFISFETVVREVVLFECYVTCPRAINRVGQVWNFDVRASPFLILCRTDCTS